jgi:hypothetical protein
LYRDNSPWAKDIDIVPVDADKPEIWADNGFGNIDGELFYYDSVVKDDNGKVLRLSNCLRQLGGTKTKFNKKGTWVRSYVIAEHHNQLVEAILLTEDFIGYNFDPRRETLDWRIRNLEALEIIFDDYDCPDVTFSFTVVSNSPVSGILANYYIQVNSGTVDSFRLDFGDGAYTTTLLQGSHQYSLNATVDPVLTISNNKCQIVQTPIDRPNPKELPEIQETTFTWEVPEVCPFPDFTVVPCEVPEPDMNIPALALPCVSVTPDISIVGPGIQLVPNVNITGPDNPINITTPTVEIKGDRIPEAIFVEPPVPPTIIVEPPIPPTIMIVTPDSQIQLNIDASDLPRLEVDWGVMPEMQVNFMMAKPVTPTKKFSVDPEIASEFGEEFADLFEASNKMKIEYEPVGIPEEIKILPPSEFPEVRLDSSSLPQRIYVDTSEVQLPTNIKILGPEHPLPNSISITFDGPPLPDKIEVINRDVPKEILVKSTLPTEIELKGADRIPHKIEVDLVQPIPHTIYVQHDIPSHISVDGVVEVKGFPEGIRLLPPESLPPVEMVWRGSPIEVKVSLEEMITKSEDRRNCVMITPCPV